MNTADAVVLESLGLSSGLIENITAWRSGNDGQEGTDDDNVFENVDDIVQDLSSSGGLSSAEKEKLEGLIEKGLIGVRSDHFRGYSVGRFQDKDASAGIAFVIDREERIRYWKED